MNKRQRKKFLKANAMFDYELKSMQHTTSSLYTNLEYERWYNIGWRLTSFICPDCGTKSWAWEYNVRPGDEPVKYTCYKCMHSRQKK